jgi:formylglycine-generating enzyme required for sulfatase activity
MARAHVCDCRPRRRACTLTVEQERALKQGDSFKECADCPEMVLVPAGSFTMGSPDKEEGHYKDEGPQHVVTIGRPFAVGKLHVTVEQFDALSARRGMKPVRSAGPTKAAKGRNARGGRGAIPALCRSVRIPWSA